MQFFVCFCEYCLFLPAIPCLRLCLYTELYTVLYTVPYNIQFTDAKLTGGAGQILKVQLIFLLYYSVTKV